MVMQRVNARASSSSALDVSVGTLSSCSAAQIQWDASEGTGPWTLVIAPINETPVSVAIPNASGSKYQYSWTAPNFSSTSNTQAFIAVADSTGKYSGVSSLLSIGPSTQNCSAPSDDLDFVWYPTDTAGLPQQCTDWGITWQKDSKDNGIEGDVTYTFLPENGTPVTVSAGKGTSKGGSFKFTIPWSSGTKFAVIANDEGKSGTGGVGDLYSVTAADKSSSSSCSVSGDIGNGLPSAATTIAAATSTSAPTSTSKSGANKGSSTSVASTASSATNASSKNAADNSTGSSSTGHSRAGAAVGATFGVLAVIALVALLLWYLKRRNTRNGIDGMEKTGDQISPWRFSSSPYDAPVTTRRSSKWFGKGGAASPSMGFRMLGERKSHGPSNSISTSFKGPVTSAHKRQQSSFSVSESAQSPNSPFGNQAQSPFANPPVSPFGNQPQSPFGAPSFRNVVPDTALFPPPRPLMSDMASNGPRTPESERSIGTPLGGIGAGLGTYENLSRQGQGPSTSPSEERMSNAISSVRKKPVGSKREFEKVPTKSIANNSYVGQPETNSYEPYTQLSQIREDQNDSVTHEIQRGGQHERGYSNGITSEVMMQEQPSHIKFSRSTSLSTSDSDKFSQTSDDALPYL